MCDAQLRIFFCNKPTLQVGSARIYGAHYPAVLKTLGTHQIVVSSSLPRVEEYDILVFGKRMFNADAAKQCQRAGKVCGSIQNGKVPDVDFYVAGAQDEIDDLAGDIPIVFLPLVENIYNKKKVHRSSNVLTLAVHGAFSHLPLFAPHVNIALKSVAAKIPVRLLAVYDIATYGQWKIGRPDIPVEDVQWDLATVEEVLLRADIGLVPNVFSVQGKLQSLILRTLDLFTLYKDPAANRLFRSKVPSNPGRALVFHQLGIPVVSGMTQAAYSTIPSEEYGFLADSAEGWKRAILMLGESAELRNNIAANALCLINTLYSPIDWAQKFLDVVTGIYLNKKII